MTKIITAFWGIALLLASAKMVNSNKKTPGSFIIISAKYFIPLLFYIRQFDFFIWINAISICKKIARTEVFELKHVFEEKLPLLKRSSKNSFQGTTRHEIFGIDEKQKWKMFIVKF